MYGLFKLVEDIYTKNKSENKTRQGQIIHHNKNIDMKKNKKKKNKKNKQNKKYNNKTNILKVVQN